MLRAAFDLFRCGHSEKSQAERVMWAGLEDGKDGAARQEEKSETSEY